MLRWTTIFALLCSAIVGTTAQAAVTFTAIGTPGYVPIDPHLFSAPIGTAATGYAEFVQTQQALLPPPNHVPNSALGIGPGSPHAGPYDAEFAQGVAANGFVDADLFTATQYSNGNGVYLVFMLIPASGSPNGSSPDFASGSVIPNAVFPLTVTGDTYTNGILNDTLAAFTVPPLDAAVGFPGIDGHSHTPFFFADNFDFASLPTIGGEYQYRLQILDSSGNGYSVLADFRVLEVPEPPTWILLGVGCIAAAGFSQGWRRVDQSA